MPYQKRGASAIEKMDLINMLNVEVTILDKISILFIVHVCWYIQLEFQ